MTLGIILTNTLTIPGQFYSVARQFDAVKVVTQWGTPGGWNDRDRARIIGMTPHTVVRTVNGDPSYRGGALRWPEPEPILAELAPWLDIQPHVTVEIGNEPNAHPEWNEDRAWAYRYWLEQTLHALRRAAPYATLIAPGPSFGHPGALRYLEICADVMRGYDAVAAHVYGHQSLQEPGVTDVLWQYDRLFDRSLPRWITELGIYAMRGPARLAAYRAFAANLSFPWRGAFAYHYCADGAVNPEYHLG